MQRVTNQAKETANLALQTLMILTSARRPLAVNELCHALAIDLENLSDGFDEDNIPLIYSIVSACAGLVVVQAPTDGLPDIATHASGASTGDSVVQLAHKSIRDYLSPSSSPWFPDAESKMAAICRIYKEAFDRADTEREHPFLDYVQHHWGHHHLMGDRESPETSADTSIEVRTAGQGSFASEFKQQAVQFGLRQLSQELGGMREVLLWACENNRVNLVEVLLLMNVDSYTQTNDDLNDSAELTDDNCKDPVCTARYDLTDIYPPHENPLKNNRSRHETCIRPTRCLREIDEALLKVVRHNRLAIAKILVAHGASLVPRDLEGLTALGRAVWEGHVDMVTWLLSLDSESMNIETLCCVQQKLVQSGSVCFDALLLIYPNARVQFTNAGFGKIWAPASPPNIEAVRGSASPEKPQDLLPYWKSGALVAFTPLSIAALNGNETCVSMILQWMQKQQHEVTREWKASCMNALLCALQRHHLTILRLLLPLVDINSTAPGLNDYTPLHIAILTENIKVV